MKTHTRSTSYSDGSELVGAADDPISGDGEVVYDGQIPISTNQEIDLAFAYANVKSLCIAAEGGGITLFSNANNGAGGNTLVIPAGLTTWNANDLAACPFTINVTKLFADNLSASAVVKLKIRVLLDVTP